MPDDSLPDLDSTDGGSKGGRKFGYTTVGDFVILSGVSDRAFRIYGLLRMHCNREREDGYDPEESWPTLRTIADMLGIKKTDGISAAIQELVEIGAVDVTVKRHRTGRRNWYMVHEAPPDDYGPGEKQGPVDGKAYYASRKNRRSDGVTPEAGGIPPDNEEPQVKGDDPSTGGDPRDGGHRSPPSGGSESPQGESPQSGGAEPPAPPDPPAEREDPDHTARGVTDRGELAGDVTTRARERGPAREAPPPPRQSPEDYPEPSPQDRVIYANTLLQACESCGAPPGRLCVRPGDTLPLPAIRAPHHTRGRWLSSGAEPSGAGAGQTRKGARKRRVSA